MSSDASWISKPHPDDARLCIADALYRNALICDPADVVCFRATLGEIRGYQRLAACDSIVYTQRHMESQQFRPFRFDADLPEAFFVSFGRNVFRSREEERQEGPGADLDAHGDNRTKDAAVGAAGGSRLADSGAFSAERAAMGDDPRSERQLSLWDIDTLFRSTTNALGVQKRSYSVTMSTQMNTLFYGFGEKQAIFLKHTQLEALLGTSTPIPDYRFTIDRFARCPAFSGDVYEVEERRFPVADEGAELWVTFRTLTTLGSKTRTVEVAASNATVRKVLEESKKIFAGGIAFDETYTWAVAGLFLRALFTLKCLY